MIRPPFSEEAFAAQRAARRGRGNPELIRNPLWDDLVRTGQSAHAIGSNYDYSETSPGWCFDRYGMSRRRLADGRIVCVAGEHEDYYDPDFFIYNDVVVIEPDGAIGHFGYSLDVFPPTDFHTATLVENGIYLIGALGYQGQRGGPAAQVMRLDLSTFAISRIETRGEQPGWIYRHRAERSADGGSIRIAGGSILQPDGDGVEQNVANDRTWQLDVAGHDWSVAEGEVPSVAAEPLDLPSGWESRGALADAMALRGSIQRAVSPSHPLFCDDYWPIGPIAREFLTGSVAIRMLDGSGRWVISSTPEYMGREAEPLALNIFDDRASFREGLINQGWND